MSKRDLIESITFIAIAVLVFFILKTFLFTTASIHGNSMEPNIESGERIVFLKQNKVKRFDIVLFTSPINSKVDLIKRVIGLPGDKIHYMDDVLYVNGLPYKEPYLQPLKDMEINGELLTPDFSLEKTFHTTKVPEDKFLVLGDNRNSSRDSRYFGFVPKKNILGIAKFTFWPLDKMGPISNTVEEEQEAGT